MNKEIMDAVQALANKLGVASEKIWEITVRQAYIDGIEGLAFFVLSISVSIWYLKNVGGWIKKAEDGDNDNICIPLAVVAVVLGILLLVSTICLFFIPTNFFNPEFWALEKITSMIKK